MKVTGLLKGLQIDVESMLDWGRLEMIALDGLQSKVPLVEALASRMAVDSDWRDYVMPDLEAQFSEQLTYIHSELRKQRSKNSELGSLLITSENVALWYGALNQARISLEHKHGVSKFEGAEAKMMIGLSEEVISAMQRYHFYTFLQSKLLDHVMN